MLTPIMGFPDLEPADHPHALIVCDADGDMDISPFPSYQDALDSLRDRASYWNNEGDEPLDITTASLEELHDLYAAGDEDAYVKIIPMERPVMGQCLRSSIFLEWPA